MVKVCREPDNWSPPYEKCCICLQETPFWYHAKDVALCEECAKVVNDENIPTKEEWWALIDE